MLKHAVARRGPDDSMSGADQVVRDAPQKYAVQDLSLLTQNVKPKIQQGSHTEKKPEH